MIEGLLVTISGSELRALCIKHALHHRERAKIYASQNTSLEENKIEISDAMAFGSDPKRALKAKREWHESEADELDFIAAHLMHGEQYLLDRDDLAKIGISQRSHF